ncbi:EAL domain-containing protein [Hyphomicrobium sp.]|uniref:putative bifunctional diguanylate cyclase/phosphodiesterase n=1 Tax=Hyphomicrobium sp. TaxID=82 RepID=UPI000FC24B03|nr:EAL domain-containing protein [Hyphomicrobium sp.]RUP10355.1 MAG: EAL domain-containing protein [Hyphomicrobium sp.]
MMKMKTGGHSSMPTARKAYGSRRKQIGPPDGLFERAMKGMVRGLAIFDKEHRLIVCNNLYREIFDLPDELTTSGATFADIIAHHVSRERRLDAKGDRALQQRRINEHLTALSEGKPFQQTRYLKSGRIILLSSQPLPDGGWVDIQEDVTAERQAEKKIEWLAEHDALTGLYNRVHFRDELQSVLASGRALAVLWIDIDDFKGINDAFGQPVGDALLKSVARRLSKVVRKSDVLARLAGDEFALIRVGPIAREEVEHLAQRLLSAIAADQRLLGRKLHVTGSLSIALAPEHGANADEILKNADLALHRAKISGRGGYEIYDPQGDYACGRAKRLDIDMKVALKKKQFELHYQPIVDVATRGVSSFEALIRWRHPERGLIPPADFIPFAEESGWIVEIGKWALGRACKDAAAWPPGIKVSVNLSSVQFEKGDLYGAVSEALAESGLVPGRLELEITESVLLRDHPKTHELLHRFRSFGVKILLDDFGTAYGSLSYLRSFPFDKLKIDRSFVRDCVGVNGRDCAAIIQSIAELAKRLRMTSIAEGVETAEQLAMVTKAGCEEVQGFYFSRPVPIGEIGATISRCREILSSTVQTSA